MVVIYNNRTMEPMFYIDAVEVKETYELGDTVRTEEQDYICGVGSNLAISSFEPVANWEFPTYLNDWAIVSVEDKLLVPDILTEEFLNSHTKAQLIQLCDYYGISGYSEEDLKAEIVSALL